MGPRGAGSLFPLPTGGKARERRVGQTPSSRRSQVMVPSLILTEPISWKASQQRPSGAGGSHGQAAPGPGSKASWVSLPQAGPGVLGEGAVWKENAPPGTPSRPKLGTIHLRHLHSTSSPAEPPRIPAYVARITVLQSLQKRTSQPWTGRGVGVPGRYLSISSHQGPLAPRPRVPAGPGSWRVVDGRYVGTGASPFGAQNPWAPRHKEIDPFQAVEELTARDIQWRTIIRVVSLGLEDVQQFLHI